MKSLPSLLRLSLCALLCWVGATSLFAKPPAKKSTPEPTPAPTPTPAAEPSTPPNSLARWLLQQNGGKDAITLPLADVVRAATGKNILPIDPASPADAAVIAKLGGVMDRVLPGMNKPESPAHVVGRTDEVVAFFEDAVRAFAATVPGFSCPEPAADAAFPARAAGSFPSVRVLDSASGKSYYLGVTLYLTGGRDAAVRALRFHPGEASARYTEDGVCLLISIEFNGKTGKEIAFLNWELIDLAKLPVHLVTTFEANQGDTHPPGTILTDGRKGRD